MKDLNGFHRCRSLLQNQHVSDSVALDNLHDSPAARDLGPRQYFFGDNSALKKINQPTNQPTNQPRESRPDITVMVDWVLRSCVKVEVAVLGSRP